MWYLWLIMRVFKECGIALKPSKFCPTHSTMAENMEESTMVHVYDVVERKVEKLFRWEEVLYMSRFSSSIMRTAFLTFVAAIDSVSCCSSHF